MSHTTQTTYANNTTILPSNKDPNIAIHNIHYHLNQISNWTNKWNQDKRKRISPSKFCS